MPKKDVDYSKTIIYKIVCKDLEVKDVYVGSTTNFTQRKHGHKSKYNSNKTHIYNRKVYVMIRKNGGFDNWEMIEIEKYPCEDSNEATTRERYYYELLNASMNSQSPNASNKEYVKIGRKERQQIRSEKYKQHNEDQKLGFRK